MTKLINLIESAFGKGRLSKNNNFDVRCPICKPSDLQKKKLSILLPSCMCHCWTCGWKSRSLAPLLRKYGTQTHFNEYRELTGHGNKSNLVTAEVQKIEKKVELPHDFQLLTIAPISDPDVKAAWRYITSRGLSERDAWYFKFGVSNESRWRRRIIMPSFDAEGKLNYFTARAIDKDRKPKYDNLDVDKNPIVFNEINIDWTQRLVLCEGPFDLTKCPENSTAILGSDLDERHEIFNKILIHNTPVILALDGDMWDTKIPKIYKKLLEYNIDVKVVDLRPWGDPGSMSKSEFEDAVLDAKNITWEDNFSRKLLNATRLQSLF